MNTNTSAEQKVADEINKATGGNVTADEVKAGAERAAKESPSLDDAKADLKPAPKKRGRPKGSTNKKTAAKGKAAPKKAETKHLEGSTKSAERNPRYQDGKKFVGKTPKALVDIITQKQAEVSSPRGALRFVAKHVGEQATYEQFVNAAVEAGNTEHRAWLCWSKVRKVPANVQEPTA